MFPEQIRNQKPKNKFNSKFLRETAFRREA